MKITTSSRSVETNLPQGSEFRIANNAKMFSILADKIYTDKPRAVVREIACNALDAHMAVGQTRPFWVSLPSRLEPMLAIRDFGPGMSHDDVIGLYTTFFDSSKTADNDQIGGFGLGSKSPFAYTDAFTVVSIQAGERRTYAAYKGDGNIPQIVLAETLATDEEDGIEVRVPVAEADVARFRTVTQDILRWFPVGSFQTFGLDVEPIKPMISKPNYLVLPVKQVNTHQVLMGPVAYKLDWAQVEGIEDIPPRTIVPVFGIGELDLPPSREQLSYDPVTIAKLKARYDQIVTEMVPQLQDEARALGPIERLSFLAGLGTGGLQGLFSAYMKATGATAEDAAARKAWAEKTGRAEYLFEGAKWGTFIERELERIRIPGRSTRREWQTASRRRKTAGVEKIGKSEFGFEIRSATFALNAYYILHDLQETATPRIMDRLGTLPEMDHYLVIDPSKTIRTLDDIRALLPGVPDDRFMVLSSITPPARPKKVKTGQTRVYRGTFGSHTMSWAEAGYEPVAGLWVPFLGTEVADGPWRTLLSLGWTEGYNVWGMSKKAQKELLDDEFSRIDEFIQDEVDRALADEEVLAAIDAEAIREQLADSLLYAFVQERANAGQDTILPTEVAAARLLQRDITAPDRRVVQRIRQMMRLKLLPARKVQDRHGLVTLIKKAERRNKQLCAVLRISQWRHLDDETLSLFTKDKA